MAIRLTKWRIFGLIVGAVLLLDQVSKTWILANFEMYESLPLIPPVLAITRSANTGAAFGIGEGWSEVFLGLSLIITAAVLYYYWRTPTDAFLQHTGLSFVLGGAWGNVLDRMQHGVVVDFVHLTLPGVISNVSNFADHAITIGVIVLLWEAVRGERAKPAPVDEQPL